MNRRIGAILAIVVIVFFVVFIVYDITSGSLFTDKPTIETGSDIVYPEPLWQVSNTLEFPDGKLRAIAATTDGRLVAGGANFLTLLDAGLNSEWRTETGEAISALAVYGTTIYAASETTITLYTLTGQTITEWGPYEDKSIITSIAASAEIVAFADAGMKRVYILKTDGSLRSFFGHEGEKFIIPSGYFDLTILPGNNVLVVNPGKQRLETRDLQGNIISTFGEPGLAPEAFSGCCNPSHYTMMNDGQVVTSEKGISRIKVMTTGGILTEYVATPDQFSSALPFDLAVGSNGEIYAASNFESKLYVFTRKANPIQ